MSLLDFGEAYEGKNLVLPALILATIHVAEAQQQKKIPRIGYLSLGTLTTIAFRIDAFRQGLRQLGYMEGKDFVRFLYP